MAFGAIDYRQLDRMSEGIASFNQGYLRNQQAKVQVQQDNADREIAMKGTALFKEKIKEALPKDGKAPNYDVMFGAAADAGSVFAQGGGRHTQAAAKEIHGFIDDLVKIHPPAGPKSEFDVYAYGGEAGKKTVTDYEKMKGDAATARAIAGKASKLFDTEYNFGTGTVKAAAMGYRMDNGPDVLPDGTKGKITHYEQIRPPSAPGGGDPTKTTIGPITERTTEGTLRLKRDKSGKPVRITQAQHTALLEKLTNAKNQRDVKRDQLERQAVEAEDDALTTESLLKQPGMDADEFTKGIVKERKNKATTLRSQVNDLEKQGKDDESLLQDIQEYDPNKVTPAEPPKKAASPVTHRYVPGQGVVPVAK